MNVKELIAKSLIEIIEEIQSTKQLIIANKYEKIKSVYAQGLFEKKLKGEIVNSVDGKDKPIFSNQEKRDAEFAVQAERDDDYKSLKEYYSNLNRIKDELYSNLEILEMVFEAKKLELELSK